MAAVVLLARESGRAGMASTALGWAVVVLLAADPATVADPGLPAVGPGDRRADRLGDPHHRAAPPTRRGRLPGWLAESLGVSFAAEAATLPVVLAGFGRLAVARTGGQPPRRPARAAGHGRRRRWPSSAAGSTALGAPGGGGDGRSGCRPGSSSRPSSGSSGRPPRCRSRACCCRHPGRPSPAAWRASPSCLPRAVDGDAPGDGRPAGGSRLRSGRRRRSGRPATGDRRARPDDRRRVPRSGRILAASVALTLVAVVVVAANRPDGQVRVTVLDVGQGDAILVEGGRGGRLLVDGGPDPDRLLVALDARLPPWDRRIDLLVLTHPHEDHVGGPGAAARALPGRPDVRARDDRTRAPATGPGRRPSRGSGSTRARSRRATGSASTRSGSECCGRIAVPCLASRPTAGRRSTTCRSSCSARSDGSASCSPVTSRRRSTRSSSPAGCPGSTC